MFRKDLISAMKLPDSEPLGGDDYWSLCDPWRQEWERGVQVPVAPDSLPIPRVLCLTNAHAPERTHDFKLYVVASCLFLVVCNSSLVIS